MVGPIAPSKALKGVAVVTGGAQGIGFAIARRLVVEGYKVAIADLNGDAAKDAARRIAEETGGDVKGMTVDITDAAGRAQMLQNAEDEFKVPVEVLVNNAGIQRVAPSPLDVDEVHWDVVMDVNAKSVYFACVEAVKYFQKKKMAGSDERYSPSIVNVASAAGKMSSTSQHPVYNVSKAAAIAITKTFGLTYASEGIRVNCVCPGIITTPMQDVVDERFSAVTGLTPQEIREGRIAKVPMGHTGTGEDVAGVVAFLAGRDAKYMTAQSVNITGGMVTY